MLTIAYITCRKEPMIQWFFDSLSKQLNGDVVQVLVCDFWSQPIPHRDWSREDAGKRIFWLEGLARTLKIKAFPPKPTPWSGPFKLSKNDYFSASNSRNTCICRTAGNYLVFCDDLSVLLPGWLDAVRSHAEAGRIVCGAFRKVNKLVVEDGEVKSFEDHPAGKDSRFDVKEYGGLEKPCPPNWLFGCSFGAPIDRFLEINGLPEMCDSTGVGMEDCQTGIAFANNGHKLYYDRNMMTYESEELHHGGSQFTRADKKGDGSFVHVRPGVDHPAEKGHHLVRVLSKAKRFHNYFEEGGIAALRKRILAGESFPHIVLPEHDWFDNQPIREL